jgi:4-amino-4-deoxy-L-arabinose transferase-like glycosyltransferase
MKKKLPYLLIAIIFLVFGWTILNNYSAYTTPYDPDYWQERYNNSQWVKGWEAGETMGDDALYAYAGWRQIQGDDPTEINPEIPPFGRYLLGLSILLFKNQNIQALFFGAGLLAVIYFLAKEILQDKTWALLPALLFSIDKLFLEDLTTSMLDLPFALFISLVFYLLIKARNNPRWYLGVVISLALVVTTKMYLVGFALTAVVGLYLLFLLIVFRYKDLLWFLLFVPIFPIIYLSIYLVYFLNGHNLIDFKELHFWIRHFARVQMPGYPKFEIWRILFLGQWHTWFGGEMIRLKQWSPLWLLSFLSVFPVAWLIFKKGIKKNLSLLLLIAYPLSLLAMYSYGLPYPRYLLPVLPPLFILLVYNIKLISEKVEWQKVKRKLPSFF